MIDPIGVEAVALLAQHDIRLSTITPIGARVDGADLRAEMSPDVVEVLQHVMASRGSLPVS